MKRLLEIHRYLPHKKPMQMVDGIREITAEGVECEFYISPESVFVEDGYLSESGMIENAAQTSSCIVAQTYFLDETENEVIGFISSIRRINILQKPAVGTRLVTKAVLLSRFDSENYSTCRVQCRTFQEETLLLEGEINLFIQEQGNEKGRSTPGQE
ncbi:ABC transporter permease [Leadbetterella sp. DM7]|uniref:ABC transporter permease n=1 Tax=Leadbetterella sp. DM7 TaxID=3235085 RepID=UPI00349E84BA